ncbi:hypothetical protein TRIUR3_06473 [Triticum urartu]|uniref:Uncharacterized protein n=1 Tax=Triticum urartu TaxID=4572 RepID=M7ZZD4_TRIUA|nr:hypothetical protein TRIUR3_06473 [Triticum urartu]
MAWAALRPVVKACIGGSLIGITISDRYFSVAAVAGGPPEQDDQEADWAARRLGQRPGEGGDPQDSGRPLLGGRGQWQRQLGLEILRPCAAWSGAGEGDTCGVATQQDGPRRQEGAAGRKGHAAAKSLVHLSCLLPGLVAFSRSFVRCCRTSCTNVAGGRHWAPPPSDCSTTFGIRLDPFPPRTSASRWRGLLEISGPLNTTRPAAMPMPMPMLQVCMKTIEARSACCPHIKKGKCNDNDCASYCKKAYGWDDVFQGPKLSKPSSCVMIRLASLDFDQPLQATA